MYLFTDLCFIYWILLFYSNFKNYLILHEKLKTKNSFGYYYNTKPFISRHGPPLVVIQKQRVFISELVDQKVANKLTTNFKATTPESKFSTRIESNSRRASVFNFD